MRHFVSCFVIGFVATIGLLVNLSPAIAHQSFTIGNIHAMVHLEPEDYPYAGKSTPTWIHLTYGNDQTIRRADCECSLTVYNSQQQPIATPELVETAARGHENPMGTTITFPQAGDYQLLLTARSKTGKFEPFELPVPVAVRP